MFAYSDRLPTGTPLPTGAITPAPWGVRRMVPYPTMAPAYSHTLLDPVTQAAQYIGLDGQAMEMPAHGTSSGTNPGTSTSPDGQGGGDADTGNDTDQ